MKNAYIAGFCKASEDSGLDPELLVKLAFGLNFTGNPVGNLQQNIQGIKDWVDNKGPATQVESVEQVNSRAGNNASQDGFFDAVSVRPTNLIDNLRGRYNQFMQNRMIDSNPNMTDAQLADLNKRYPQPYGIVADDQYLGYGNASNYSKMKKMYDKYKNNWKLPNSQVVSK